MSRFSRILVLALTSLAMPCAWLSAADSVSVTERGVAVGAPGCQASALESLVASSPDGTEFAFPAGRYFLSRPVRLNGRRGLSFVGRGDVKFVLHFSPCGELSENNAAFAASECAGLLFSGFAVTTDNPPNCSGTVVAKDPVRGTYDVRICDEFPITGWEHFWGTDTFDVNGVPDYVIETYDAVTPGFAPDGSGGWRKVMTGVRYEMIGPQLIRVLPPHMRPIDFTRLRIGHGILFRYMIYGSTVFDFTACRDVTLRDIEVERCASFGVMVSPPSANFSFERFNMRRPSGSKALYCANADGVHVLGLSGSLTMTDCHFDRLGDDCLNIHGVSGEVKAFDPASGLMTCVCRNRQREETVLPAGWANSGDSLVVYDPDTLQEKGTVEVLEYGNGSCRARPGPTDVRIGDLLSNAKDFASVRLRGCTFERTRARGILLRSRNMTVEDCVFRGLSLAGVLISTDFHYWNEAGPTVNTEIRNCVFERCGIVGEDPKMAGFSVNTSDDAQPGERPAGVHRDIRVIGSRFADCGNNGICVNSTAGLKIVGNDFIRCASLTANSADPGAKCDIRLTNCTGVELSGNRSDKPADQMCRSETRVVQTNTKKGKGR